MLIALIIVSVLLVIAIGLLYIQRDYIVTTEVIRMPNQDAMYHPVEIELMRDRLRNANEMISHITDVFNKPIDTDDVRMLCSKLYWLSLNGKSTKEMDAVLHKWKQRIVTNYPA